MGTDDVLTVRGLRKRYRGRQGVQANDGIDLDVAAGQVVGLLGHNGAGKSTLVHQVVGIVRPDSGSITLDGVDAVARPDLARRAATVQAQANVPITGLTPRRAIELVGGSDAATAPPCAAGPRSCSTPSTWAPGRTPRRRRSPAASRA